MNRFALLIILLICVFSIIGNGFDYPKVMDDGRIFFTSYNGWGIFSSDGNGVERISSEHARGRYINIYGNTITYKKAYSAENQIPVILGLRSREFEFDDINCNYTGIPYLTENATLIPSEGKLYIFKGSQTKIRDMKSSVQYIDVHQNNICYIDDNGFLIIMNIQNGNEYIISENAGFHPKFSPDGRAIVTTYQNGANIYRLADELENGFSSKYFIQDAQNPIWYGNGLIYQFTNEYNYHVDFSELFYYDLNSHKKYPITSTDDIHETRPSLSENSKFIVFRDIETGSIYRAELNSSIDNNLRITNRTLIANGDDAPEGFPEFFESVIMSPMETMESISCPYLHQVYDTPDWHNGHWSCGPASCLMAVQKYDILPDHNITVSSPYSHTHPFGWYVPNTYTYNGYTYDISGLAAGDTWVTGAHGFICREYGGAVWAHMETFMEQHGLDSWYLGAVWSTYTGQISDGYPVVSSTSVMGYGHIQCFIGYFGDHGIITNDPYGNANYSPWCQYNGENVRYDWPGYDNGYLEISISQLFAANGPLAEPTPSTPDTLVDDWSSGFHRAEAGGAYWYQWIGGFYNHVWWTYSMDASADDYYGKWYPVLPNSGVYEVYVHIPSNHANAQARYKVFHNTGEDVVTVNQTLYYDDWVSIGTYGFGDEDGGYVYLGDNTGTADNQVGYDAVKWSYRDHLVYSDTLIDDTEDGFDKDGNIDFFHHQYSGYGGHSWYTYSTHSEDTCSATWRANLSRGGVYEVSVYIPDENAAAHSAQYHVHHADGEDVVWINQGDHSDEWVSLGTFDFNYGTSGYVYLGDATGAPGYKINFDAVKFTYLYATNIEEDNSYNPHKLTLKAGPNPFNSSCRISSNRPANIKIFDTNGSLIERFIMKSANEEIIWQPEQKQNSAIYLITAEWQSQSKSRRVVLIK
ncbi:MAG: C39 family peptidase [Candidatus Zixiibacteriota bacterium]